eukprot:CAMPEP_0171133498 /NCGR_PEP_ID=MMETSP0766_2-20121228/126401_1 /TAXON_ID=439317 /ORGANISM="Gambierdiscus australes, Strain CAWD 149" /LENGTH=172 /DNA_ID=CAMNT_0011596885 /DNA_START=149 /DNA_END=664 /DNA_ORIENTATION=-
MAQLKPQPVAATAPAANVSAPEAPAAGGSKLLTDADINYVAARLGVEPACVKAVYTVESSGKGFLSNGDLASAQEIGHRSCSAGSGQPRHYYEHWTRGRYKGSVGEYDRLNRAIAINRPAALASASWGTFQIMVFNFKACGYNNAEDYVKAVYVSEGKHLEAFGNFIKSVNL